MPEITFANGKIYTEQEFERLGLEIMPIDERRDDGRRVFCEPEFIRRFAGDVYDDNLRFRHHKKDKGEWVLWTGKYWKAYNETDIRNDINMLLFSARDTYKPATWKEHALDTIRSNLLRKWVDFDDHKRISMEDGTYMVDNGQLKRGPHRKEDFCLNGLPYNLTAKKSEIWEKIQTNLFDDIMDRMALQEMFGACMFPGFSNQVIFNLHGDDGTGKTTIARLLFQLLGEQRCTGLNLASIKNDTHILSTLQHSWVNIDSESKGVEEEAERYYKRISGGDWNTINPKYVDPFQKLLFTKLIILTNELPHWNDKSGALWSRLVLISFRKKQFGRELDNVLKDLKREGDSIASWAFVGLRRLLSKPEADQRRNRYTQSAYANALWERNKELTNPMITWWNESVIIGTGNVAKHDAYHDWECWRQRCGYKQISYITFCTQVKNIFPNIEEDKSRSISGRFARWKGVRLNRQENLLQHPPK